MAGLRRNVELYERRVRLGLTQAQVAELVTARVQAAGRQWEHTILTREYISRLESGRITWPNAVYRAALRRVLGAETDTELGLVCQRVRTARAEVDGVRRRDFLAVVPAVAMTGSSLTELVAAATAQPVPPPRRVGLEHAAQVRDLVRQADVLDHLYGGGLAHEVIAAQVRWAVGLLDADIDCGARTELMCAVGHLCGKAGFAAHDHGLHDAARHYYAAALRCAEQADDWHLRGRALSDLVQIAVYVDRGDEALTLVQQAAVRADRLGSLRRVRIALQEAAAHGRLGNAQASLAAIGRAEDDYAGADRATDPDDFGTRNLCPAELMAASGDALFILALRGQCVDAAVNRLREAVANYPDAFPRSRALATARLSTLLMRTGDPTEAVQLGHRVLDATNTLRSARIADAIRDLYHAAKPHRGNPDVDDLRLRATRILADSA